MNTAVLLVLAFLAPTGKIEAETVTMQDEAHCSAAAAAFVAPRTPQFPPPFLNEPNAPMRWATCVSLLAGGHDAAFEPHETVPNERTGAQTIVRRN